MTPTLSDASNLLSLGKPHNAMPIARALLSDNPSNIQALYLLGVCNFRLKDYSAADKTFRQVLALDNNHYGAHYHIGMCLERQQRVKEALTEYRIAEMLKPDFAEAKKKIAELKGRNKEATNQQQKHAVPPNASPAKQPADPTNVAGPGDLLLKEHRRAKSFTFTYLTTWILGISAILSIFFFFAFPAIPLLLGMATLANGLILNVYVCNTSYEIYERRIDFKFGVIFRKTLSLYLFQIVDVYLTRSPMQQLLGDATIMIMTPPALRSNKRPGEWQIKGLGTHKQMEKIFSEIRNAALVERRAMKNFFI